MSVWKFSMVVVFGLLIGVGCQSSEESGERKGKEKGGGSEAIIERYIKMVEEDVGGEKKGGAESIIAKYLKKVEADEPGGEEMRRLFADMAEDGKVDTKAELERIEAMEVKVREMMRELDSEEAELDDDLKRFRDHLERLLGKYEKLGETLREMGEVE
ncbi:MAG: hypothetical protein ACYTFG_00605 [Planctomycetota bacterium]